MAVHDPEEFDGVDLNDRWDFDPGPEVIRVRFTVRDARVSGSVLEDVHGKARAKIVFLARTWLGPQPKDGEELRALVVHETKKDDPRKGVLFVERILPVIDRGGQYGKCSNCGEWEVPLYDYTPLGKRINDYGYEYPAQRATLRQISSCKKCDTLHRICPASS